MESKGSSAFATRLPGVRPERSYVRRLGRPQSPVTRKLRETDDQQRGPGACLHHSRTRLVVLLKVPSALLELLVRQVTPGVGQTEFLEYGVRSRLRCYLPDEDTIDEVSDGE